MYRKYFNSISLVILKNLVRLYFFSHFFVISFGEENKTQFKELDRWFDIYLKDSKVGYAHSTMKFFKDTVVSESVFNVTFNRNGSPVRMNSYEKTEESKKWNHNLIFKPVGNGRCSNSQKWSYQG